MKYTREIQKVVPSRATMEGAGVRLKRAFAQADPWLDPFLLLDDFHSSKPEDYILGFPWHPHRGMETITYMLEGSMRHEDSMGHAGVIGPGEVQWMTAGSGIIHSEMPGQKKGILWGLQLWANLPSTQKMMQPRYRGLAQSDIPEVKVNDQVLVKIIAGEVATIRGPVTDIVAQPEYLDVAMEPGGEFAHAIPANRNAIAYVLSGEAYFGRTQTDPIDPEHLVIFGPGDAIKAFSKDQPARFILISGQPLREPVAWGGPIVMNTEEELQQAFKEYRVGTFIKHSHS